MARKQSKTPKAKKVKAVKRAKKPKAVLDADPGRYDERGMSADLLVRRAQEVETALITSQPGLCAQIGNTPSAIISM